MIEGYVVSRMLSGIFEDLESVIVVYRILRFGENLRLLYEKDLIVFVDVFRRLINYNVVNRIRFLSNNYDIINLVKIFSNLLELVNLLVWKIVFEVIFK